MNKKTLNTAINVAKALCPESLKKGIGKSHVAFLVKKNKIVKIGLNKNKTHPNNKNFAYRAKDGGNVDVGLHAEMAVILKLKEKVLNKYSLIVLRVDGEGRLNSSRPCPGCQELIDSKKIKTTYFSCADGSIKQESFVK